MFLYFYMRNILKHYIYIYIYIVSKKKIYIYIQADKALKYLFTWRNMRT